MTNKEIIIGEAILNEIFTAEEIEEYLETRGELPLHTFAAWKARGYAVKKGEKATLATRLWKYKKGVKQNDKGEEEESLLLDAIIDASAMIDSDKYWRSDEFAETGKVVEACIKKAQEAREKLLAKEAAEREAYYNAYCN